MNENKFWLTLWLGIVTGIVAIIFIINLFSLQKAKVRSTSIKQDVSPIESRCANTNSEKYLKFCSEWLAKMPIKTEVTTE